MKVKLTKRAADSAKLGERDLFLWDSVLPGFGLKVTPKGRRVFVLQYWVNGRARRVTLGLYGAELTVDQARAKARNLRGQVAAGGDPAAERARVRAVPTLAEFAERYMAEHAAVKKKPRSYEGDALNLRLHVLPTLGRLRLDQVTRADVARFHAGMRDRPFQANRCLALLSMMFTLAEAWGVQPDGSNPTRHVQKYPERKVERYLSDAELARLGGALEDAANTGEHPSVIAAIRLLIFTGCRRDEILKLRWEYVDFERGCLNLPESKTGAKVVPLGAPALQLLTKLPRNEGNPFVLPGKVPGRHFVGIQKAWERLRAQAGLSDVRLNDLRHTHASVGAAAGESLLVIGALLGHQQQATTQRYAHLSDDPVRAAAERIDEHLEAALKGRSGEVVPLKSER
ncbi:MAG: tyrosine-type recombinase/integrase [Alphaproteobacteria bacterium]